MPCRMPFNWSFFEWCIYARFLVQRMMTEGGDWIVTRKILLRVNCGRFPRLNAVVRNGVSCLVWVVYVRTRRFWCSAWWWRAVFDSPTRKYIFWVLRSFVLVKLPCRMAFTWSFFWIVHSDAQNLGATHDDGGRWLGIISRKYLGYCGAFRSRLSAVSHGVTVFFWSGVCRRAFFTQSTSTMERQGLNSHEKIFFRILRPVRFRLSAVSHGVHWSFLRAVCMRKFVCTLSYSWRKICWFLAFFFRCWFIAASKGVKWSFFLPFVAVFLPLNFMQSAFVGCFWKL